MKQRSKIVRDAAQIFRLSHSRLSLGGLCFQTGQLSTIPVYKINIKHMTEEGVARKSEIKAFSFSLRKVF